MNWGNYTAHFICFLSLRSHCPALLDVQSLKTVSYIFVCFSGLRCEGKSSSCSPLWSERAISVASYLRMLSGAICSWFWHLSTFTHWIYFIQSVGLNQSGRSEWNRKQNVLISFNGRKMSFLSLTASFPRARGKQWSIVWAFFPFYNCWSPTV